MLLVMHLRFILALMCHRIAVVIINVIIIIIICPFQFTIMHLSGLNCINQSAYCCSV